jgi:acetyl esterase/lipase
VPGERVEKNIVFGMYSGLALLMDIHRPEKPEGRAVLFVGGSGWESSLGMDAYTVFAVNHRAAPRFRYPAALEDVQRAIRFIRFHSREYGIDPGRIGAVAGSSGAHLACLAAMLGSEGLSGDADPVNRESSNLQCLVLRAAPTDLWQMATCADDEGRAYAISFIEGGDARMPSGRESYDAAAPLRLIPSSAPPTLLIHGDEDRMVPYIQSVAMEAALLAVGAEARLLTIPGGVHGPDFGAEGKPRPEWPDYLGEMVTWLDGHLT